LKNNVVARGAAGFGSGPYPLRWAPARVSAAVVSSAFLPTSLFSRLVVCAQLLFAPPVAAVAAAAAGSGFVTGVVANAATDTFGNPAANPGGLLMRLPGVAVNFVSGEAVEIFLRGMGTSFISITSLPPARNAARASAASR
jgi:hypothetical protein